MLLWGNAIERTLTGQVCAIMRVARIAHFLSNEADLPRLRATDRRAAGENRRTALRPRRFCGRHLGRDQPASEKEPATHQGNLRQAHRVADRASGSPCATP